MSQSCVYCIWLLCGYEFMYAVCVLVPSADIDECSEDVDNCVVGSNCTNTEGSFICQCGFGFIGDGRTAGTGCTGIAIV